MTIQEKTLLEKILKLPLKSRMGMVTKILKSVSKEDEKTTKLWIEEAERRIAAVANGDEELLPGPEVREEIRRKYNS